MNKKIIEELDCYGVDKFIIYSYEEKFYDDGTIDEPSSIEFEIYEKEGMMGSGYLKFDGCINIEFDGYVHFCGYKDMKSNLELITNCIYTFGRFKMSSLQTYGNIEGLTHVGKYKIYKENETI